jgi:hypothetical protein
MVRSVENAAKRTTLNPFARQARKSRKGTPSVDYDSDDFCDIKVVTLVPINTVCTLLMFAYVMVIKFMA